LTSNRAVGAQLLFDVTANAAADDQGSNSQNVLPIVTYTVNILGH
jgi:hypothetical protein